MATARDDEVGRRRAAGRRATAATPRPRPRATEKSAEQSRAPRPTEIARRALRQVHELTGKQPEGVTSLQRDGTGWSVGVEVVETHRIPDSTDILAVYQAELDADGELTSYHRSDRYLRGRGDDQR